jgi:hypothetical protein
MEIPFLLVSCVAALWQSWMCYQLIAPRDAIRGTVISRGLIRTSACRIGAAMLYVLVGINALFVHWLDLQVAFGVFAATQLMWCINGFADIQLRQRIAATKTNIANRDGGHLKMPWPYRPLPTHRHRPSLEDRINQMEDRIMSKLDDIETQFVAAINSIAQELQTEVSSTEDSVAARFQPFADRLTALGSNPQAEVPAASGSTGGTDTSGGTSTPADSGSSGGAASSTTAGATPTDGSTGSTASA